MKKKIIPLILVLALASFLLWRWSHPREFLYAGTVEATEVDISARVPAVIDQFPAQEGQEVRAGQLLVRLNGDDFRLAADIAEKDFRRAERLFKEGSMPQEAYDRTLYKFKDAALRRDWCTINSPLDGTVLATYHEVGELVNPGAKLLTLANLQEVWAMVYVPQPLLAKLALNQSVEAVLPEAGHRAYTGRVTHINDEAEFTPKNVQTREERTRLVYGVKITFTNPDRVLKPGMTVEVRLPKV